MFIKLIPDNANYLKVYWQTAIDLSKKNRRMGIVLPVQLVAIEAIDSVSYLFHGIFKCGSKLSSGEFKRAFTHLRSDLFSSLRCGFLIFVQIPYIFSNLFWNHKNLSEIKLPLYEKTKQKLQRIEKEKNDLVEQLKQFQIFEEEKNDLLEQLKKFQILKEKLNKELQKVTEERQTLRNQLFDSNKKSFRNTLYSIEEKRKLADQFKIQEEKAKSDILFLTEQLKAKEAEIQKLYQEQNQYKQLSEELFQSLRLQHASDQTYVNELREEKNSIEDQIFSLSQYDKKPLLGMRIGKEIAWKYLKYRQFLKQTVEKSGLNLSNISSELRGDSTLIKHTKDVLNFLDTPLVDTRIQYRKFIAKLREAILTEEYQNTIDDFINNKKAYENLKDSENGRCVKIILDICEAMFAKIELYPFTESLLDAVVGPQDRTQDIFQILENQKTAIGRLNPAIGEYAIKRQLGNLKGQTDIDFDPHYNANLKYRLHQEIYHKDGKNLPMDCIRMGTPTYQPTEIKVAEKLGGAVSSIPGAGYLSQAIKQISTYCPTVVSDGVNNAGQALKETISQLINPTEVIPEFTAFLDCLVLKNMKLVYFNHQNLISSINAGEKGRSFAFIKLQKHERYQDHFFVFTQPFDTSFIEDAFGRDHETWHADYVKKELLGQMKPKPPKPGTVLIEDPIEQMSIDSEQSGFSFPLKFPFSSWEKPFEDIIDRVHAYLFDKLENLSINERIPFILISFVFFKKYIKTTLGVDIFLSVCKDDLDRGGLMKVVEYYIDLILLGKQDDPKELKILTTMVDAAPLLVKKQAMIESRRKILIECLKFLKKIKKDQLQEIISGNYELTNLKTYNEQKIDFYPVPAKSMTNLEYWTCLKNDAAIFPEHTRTLPIEIFKRKDSRKNILENNNSLEMFKSKTTFKVNKSKKMTIEDFEKTQSYKEFWDPISSSHEILKKVHSKLQEIYDNKALGFSTVEGETSIKVNSKTEITKVMKTFSHQNFTETWATRVVTIEINQKNKTVKWSPADLKKKSLSESESDDWITA